MDQESYLSGQQPEVIREQIDMTRSDLTNKLEALEQRVVDSVSEAKEAVTDTVETVKESVDHTIQAVRDTVHDTVDSVKRNLDLARQVDRHPWGMFGGAIAAGFVAGHLFEGLTRRPSVRPLPQAWRNGRRPMGTPLSAAGPAVSPALDGAAPSFVSSLADKFGPEIEQLKGLALGAVMSLARDFVKQSLPPSLAPEVGRMADDVTTKLGGKPIAGPVFEHTGGKNGF
jgi:ElaB/YqjD/DUF883 family membrane-anchored ribosome-binding protein